MKRLLTTITIIGLMGLAAWYFFQKDGGVKDIEFVKLEKLQINKLVPFPKLMLEATANAVLNNPNIFGAEITETNFDIYVEGKHTTTVNQKLSIDMPADAEFMLPLSFEIPLGKAGFFKDAKDMLTGAWKNQSIKIKTVGSIQVTALKIQFDIPFEEESAYLLKDYLPK